MDFEVITARGAHRVMTTHRGDVDETPLQLISAQRLAEYQKAEAELLALRQKLAGLPAAK